MQKIMKNNGITLIALVVTIIILIILAGISINLVFGEYGIIQKAKDAKEAQIKGEILQELELQKGKIMINGKGYTDLGLYLEHIEKNNLNGYKVTSIEYINDSTSGIWINNKYYYTAAQIDNNVVINAIGYAKELEPEIQSFIITAKTSNSIEVEVKARMADTYEFYIDDEKVETIKKNKKETNEIETITYKYTNLKSLTEEDVNYTLKIIATNKNGDAEATAETKTKEIEVPLITVEDAETWTNKTKTISITTDENYKTIYTLDGTVPSATNGIEYTEKFTVDKNCIITAVYLDTTNQIGASDVNEVTRIDKLDPEGTISTTATTNSVTVTVNAKDKEETSEYGNSGIKGYYYSNDGGNTYTEIIEAATYTFDKLSPITDYNIAVKVEDNAGNIITLEGLAKTNVAATYTSSNKTYNKLEQTGVTGTNVDITGTYKATNAGTYTAYVTPKPNFAWSDGTTETQPITWSIAKINGSGSVTMAGWVAGNTASNPTPSSSTNGTSSVTYQYKVSTAADSTYTTTKPTAAGTYTVRATFAATTNYNACTATANFTISAAIAKVNTTYYSSLANAINATTTGTITMQANTTESPTIATGKNITLALNGKTITGCITNNGTLTVSGGTITNSAPHAIKNNKTLTISGGTYSSTASNSTISLSAGSSTTITGGTFTSTNHSALSLHGCTATISGAIIKSTATGSSAINMVDSQSTLTFSGSSIDAVLHGINANIGGNIEIKGGTITSSAGHPVQIGGGDGSVKISGGTLKATGKYVALYTSDSYTGTVTTSGGSETTPVIQSVSSKPALEHQGSGKITISGGRFISNSTGKTNATIYIGSNCAKANIVLTSGLAKNENKDDTSNRYLYYSAKTGNSLKGFSESIGEITE